MNDLPTTTDSGTQQTVSDPQNAINQGAAIQNNKDDTPLNTSANQDGVALKEQQGETINVASVSSQATNSQPNAAASNVGLSVLSVLLFVAAALLFASTLRSSKNTTV